MIDFVIELNNKKYSVIYKGGKKIIINNSEYTIDEFYGKNENEFLLRTGRKVYNIVSGKSEGSAFTYNIGGNLYRLRLYTALQHIIQSGRESRQIKEKHSEIKAPMPGLIVKLHVQQGSVVKKGQSLLVLEAMKMENEIQSPRDGKIKEVRIKSGTSVEKNEILIVME
ncbi:biotin carboxyl carrier protein [Melioribacter roseus P3M-2]|uniref:Biotin carboxyl carrier protein n=1 Tax=Melioribacter roseus (strain DSM 23840 / JCM 17771 / VKM B-2668 / P3M-2) TaxID=1191523 RepID=I6ZUU7_MELRP|nr:acetyl-CoA carboxylase biotin carboxyl carrier protein subunit [Melioribacter roseus]AFN75794.1 biotin carboxyl carrier protein [Melioribacter roseus P3M-2]